MSNVEPVDIPMEDIEDMFLREVVYVGKTAINVSAFALKDLPDVTKELIARVQKNFANSNITRDTFMRNLHQVAYILLTEMPHVVSKASGISVKQLEMLPIDVGLDVAGAIVRVNRKAKESLEKNFGEWLLLVRTYLEKKTKAATTTIDIEASPEKPPLP